jgi:hypothetical protein
LFFIRNFIRYGKSRKGRAPPPSKILL